MKQPINKKSSPQKSLSVKKRKTPTKNVVQKYGTSKLEDRFAKDFLDKLGYKYERQYEAKSIKRFYDFAVKQENGAIVLIEIDGDYW